MTQSKWVTRICRILLCVGTGATLLGTSCGAELRASLIGAGADFAGNSLTTLLETLIPVEEIVGGEGE